MRSEPREQVLAKAKGCEKNEIEYTFGDTLDPGSLARGTMQDRIQDYGLMWHSEPDPVSRETPVIEGVLQIRSITPGICLLE